MKRYAVANRDETGYYSSGYDTPAGAAKVALEFALSHDPFAHIVEYEFETAEELNARLCLKYFKERNAAIHDMQIVARTMCKACKHRLSITECEIYGRKRTDACYCGRFEWRGLVKENTSEYCVIAKDVEE